MKKLVLLLYVFSSYIIVAQDTTTNKKGSIIDTTKQHRKKIHNEIGVNATYIVTNIFNNVSSASIQPYQLTYKLIKNRWAIRTALGITITHSVTVNTSGNQNSPFQTPPDDLVPNYFNSFRQYARLGWEYRFRVSRTVIAYTGIDIVEQIINTSSQSMFISNNLPISYDYSVTRSFSNSGGLGMGAVLGIQWFCTRRISVYTEIPFYYLGSTTYSHNTLYKNILNQNTGGFFVSSTSYQTQYARSSAFSITIPATIYLAIKF